MNSTKTNKEKHHEKAANAMYRNMIGLTAEEEHLTF